MLFYLFIQKLGLYDNDKYFKCFVTHRGRKYIYFDVYLIR